MKAGKTDPRLNLDKGRWTDEIVAHKLGIGGKDTYQKILPIGMKEGFQSMKYIRLSEIVNHKLKYVYLACKQL